MTAIIYTDRGGVLRSRDLALAARNPDVSIKKSEHESATQTQTWVQSEKDIWQCQTVGMLYQDAYALWRDLVYQVGREFTFDPEGAVAAPVAPGVYILVGRPRLNRIRNTLGQVSFTVRQP